MRRPIERFDDDDDEQETKPLLGPRARRAGKAVTA